MNAGIRKQSANSQSKGDARPALIKPIIRKFTAPVEPTAETNTRAIQVLNDKSTDFPFFL